ncbi:hypothetical protein FPV16_20725 [Methylobacterium sp. W2]|uniref:hypothetical protein n=1 Tax=Methylobacterium sp. W2 TaxID=2598107 RepID=UPI001D0C8680|nr:hypothetical protein [Methylobacterium sp. W2]MCC0808602.1 hypothetical protein [Methylobacterium sp. W2]
MPLSTELPVGDLYEVVGNFRLNGDGPPTTGRMGLARLQEILLNSTSLVGARLVDIETRLASRITTLEGLAGIPGGANLSQKVDDLNIRVGNAETAVGSLASDSATLRGTRYFGRPAKDLRAWTARHDLPAKDAPPLTTGGVYTITTNGPGGSALCITGNGYASSIAKIPIDDGEIIELTFKQARRTDNTGANAAANNVPVNDVGCYRADGSFITTVPLPATALLKADLVRSVTYRVSLTAALSQASLPAGTREICPVVGERGATGAMEFYAVERNSQSLTSAPEMTDAIASEDRLFIFDDSAKLIKKYTFAQLEAYLAPPRLYQFEIRGVVVSNESSVVLSADDLRRDVIEIQAASQCQLAVRWGGGAASFVDGGSWIQSSDWLNHNGGQGSCSIAVRAKEGDGPTVPFSTTLIIRVNRTVNVPPNALTKGDIVLGRMKDPMDPRYAAIIKKEVDDSVAIGDFPKWPLWCLINSSKENVRVNIGNPTGRLFTFREGTSGTPIQINPYVNLVGNGQDQNIDTTYMPAEVGWLDASHALAARAGSTAVGGANPQIASNLINVQPNRTTTDHGFSSGSQTDRTSALGTQGKWVGLSRISTGSFRTFIDEAFSAEFVRANPAVVPRTIKLMSGAGVAGNSDYSAAPFAGAFAGPGVTDAEFIRQVQRVKRIEAVGALIASGA